jgi:hypothetical protein
MTALYNEIDPYAAGWLENLAATGHIMGGRMTPADISRLWTLAALDAARVALSTQAALTAELYDAIRTQQDVVRALTGHWPEWRP